MNNKPAILLITCDELNRSTLGAYGNEAISTPNIDSIASEGCRYDNAFTVSPWCLPARCAILTGLYPHKSGAYSNFRRCQLDNSIPNLFTELKKGGYDITMFGKCHFAPVPYGQTKPDKTLPYDEFRDYYLSLGIDHLELEDDKQVSVWFMDDWAKDADKRGWLEVIRAAVWNRDYRKVYPFPAPLDLHPDVWVGDRTVEYINAADPETPFFSWVSFSGPHYPMDAPQEYIDRVNVDKLTPMVKREGELSGEDRIHHKSYYGGGFIDGCHPAPGGACMNYTDEYWVKMRTNYNAVVSLIDDKVGEIISAAKSKFSDNLLVIFTADHGEMLGNHGIWGKHSCAYNEVWKIPMFVSYPGRAERGIREYLVNSTDILPTCLQAAGLQPPAVDGLSMKEDTARKYTFGEGEQYIAVTDGKRKYVHVQYKEHYRELLDNIEDPCEFENKISDPAYAPVLAELREKIIDHFMGKILP